MRLQAKGYDAFVYVTHLLGEAGVVGTPYGANTIEIPDDAKFDPEVEAELARFTTGGNFAAAPPVGDEGEPAAPVVGNQPLSPASQSPLAPPPRSGAGASRQAWARYAAQRKPPVQVTADMARDDIIRAVEAQTDDR